MVKEKKRETVPDPRVFPAAIPDLFERMVQEKGTFHQTPYAREIARVAMEEHFDCLTLLEVIDTAAGLMDLMNSPNHSLPADRIPKSARSTTMKVTGQDDFKFLSKSNRLNQITSGLSGSTSLQNMTASQARQAGGLILGEIEKYFSSQRFVAKNAHPPIEIKSGSEETIRSEFDRRYKNSVNSLINIRKYIWEIQASYPNIRDFIASAQTAADQEEGTGKMSILIVSDPELRGTGEEEKVRMAFNDFMIQIDTDCDFADLGKDFTSSADTAWKFFQTLKQFKQLWISDFRNYTFQSDLGRVSLDQIVREPDPEKFTVLMLKFMANLPRGNNFYQDLAKALFIFPPNNVNYLDSKITEPDEFTKKIIRSRRILAEKFFAPFLTGTEGDPVFDRLFKKVFTYLIESNLQYLVYNLMIAYYQDSPLAQWLDPGITYEELARTSPLVKAVMGAADRIDANSISNFYQNNSVSLFQAKAGNGKFRDHLIKRFGEHHNIGLIGEALEELFRDDGEKRSREMEVLFEAVEGGRNVFSEEYAGDLDGINMTYMDYIREMFEKYGQSVTPQMYGMDLDGLKMDLGIHKIILNLRKDEKGRIRGDFSVSNKELNSALFGSFDDRGELEFEFPIDTVKYPKAGKLIKMLVLGSINNVFEKLDLPHEEVWQMTVNKSFLARKLEYIQAGFGTLTLKDLEARGYRDEVEAIREMGGMRNVRQALGLEKARRSEPRRIISRTEADDDLRRLAFGEDI